MKDHVSTRDGHMAKVMHVTERGGKTRLVSKSSGVLCQLSTQVLSPVLAMLKRVQEAKTTLAGDRRGAIKEIFGNPNVASGIKRSVISADLTSASDRIPLDVANAIWDELEAAS